MLKKSKSGIIIIMAAVVSMLLLGATGLDPKKMTEAEIEALLKPEQYIAVDTLGDSHYLVKFMKGEKAIKELELKMGFKEYKSESLSVRIDHSAKIEGKIFDIRTVSYRKDSIYLNPTIHLSPDNTKMAIKWENLIKRNNCEVEKIYELDSIMKTTNNRTGLRNVDKIEVYNEDGKKMYEVDGAEAGWEESGYFLYDELPEMYYKDVKYYLDWREVNPFMFIDYIYDNGILMVSNSLTEGNNLKNVKIYNERGEEIFSEAVRAWLSERNLCKDGKDIYFAYKGKSKGILMKIEGKGVREIKEIAEVNTLANMDVYAINDEIVLIIDKTDNLWIENREEKGKEIIYFDKDLEEKSRKSIYGEYVFRGYTALLGETIVIYPDKQANIKPTSSTFSIYFVTKESEEKKQYDFEYYRRNMKGIYRTDWGYIIDNGQYFIMNKEKEIIGQVK